MKNNKINDPLIRQLIKGTAREYLALGFILGLAFGAIMTVIFINLIYTT